MKFKVGDKVIVTAGKDKGMKSVITQVLPKENRVVVEGANLYVKHVKPMPLIDRPGERRRQERALPTANIAIVNNKGEPDRIGYKIKDSGEKVRIYKKTGEEIEDQKKAKPQTKKKSKKKESKKNNKKTKSKKKEEKKKEE